MINSCHGNTRLLAICDLELNLIKVDANHKAFILRGAVCQTGDELLHITLFFFFIIASFTEQQYTHIYICDIDRATWTKTVPRTTQMNVCVWVLVYTLIGFLKLHIQAFMLAGAF